MAFSGQKALKLFQSTCTEVLKPTAYSSWRVPTCHSRILFDELAEVCKISLAVPAVKHNIEPLISEIKYMTARDTVIRRKYPHVYRNVDSLKSIKDKPTRLHVLAELINSQLENYSQSICDVIDDCLREQRFDSEHDITRLIQTYIADCVWKGFSPTQIRIMFRELSQSSATSTLQEFRQLSSAFARHDIPFRCMTLLNWPLKRLGTGLNTLGITLGQSPPPSPTRCEQQLLDRYGGKGSVVATQTVVASDLYAARSIAVRNLSRAFSLINFYRPKITHQIKGEVIAITNSESHEENTLASIHEESFLHLKNASSLKSRIHRAASIKISQESIDTKNAIRLGNAFEYHSLSLNAPSDEIKLVNLWVSLESMIPAHDSTIIESITSYLSSCISMAYVYSSVRSLANEVSRTDVYQDYFDIATFPESSKQRLRTKDLLRIITDKREGVLSRRFETMPWPSPTILNRYSFLRKDVLFKPSQLRKRLRSQIDLVSWQVRRIYRERNRIAHSGRSGKILSGLLDNLVAYQNASVRNIMHDLECHPHWTIEHAVEYRRSGMNGFLEALNHASSNKITLARLLDPLAQDQGESDYVRCWEPVEKHG